MFRHILIPTDGSELSGLAVEKGLALAKEMDAAVTAVHVGTTFDFFAAYSGELSGSLDQYEALVARKGKEILDEVVRGRQ